MGKEPGRDDTGDATHVVAPRSVMDKSVLGGSFWQAQAMARTLGVNLTKLRLEGGVDAEGLGRIASTCEACKAHAECVGFVAAPPQAAVEAPGFCPLSASFDRLIRLSRGQT